MPLGTNNDVCKEVLKTEMGKIPGSKVEHPDVQPSFDSLSTAIHTILTDKAEVLSISGADTDYWTWLVSVSTWIKEMSTWQRGVIHALKTWTPTQPADQAFQTELLALVSPGEPPASAPIQLKGRIQ